MPDGTDTKKKKKSFFQHVAELAKDFLDWVVDTFGDELSDELMDDLGLNRANPATPKPTTLDGPTRARIEAFAAKEDIDKAALLEIVADLKSIFDTIMTFIDAVKADGVDARTIFWMMFKLFTLDSLRVRNPSAYAFVQIAGLVTEDDETLLQLDASLLTKLVRGEATEVDGEAWVQRLSMLGGVTTVLIANKWKALDGVIDAVYGWDPDPGEEGEAAVVASRALTVVLAADVLNGVRPAITLIGVPKAHGGPGVFVSATSGFQFPMDVGQTTYTFELTGAGQFGVLISGDDPQFVANFAPAIRVSAAPKPSDEGPPNLAPALLIGTSDSSRLEIGTLAYGVEIAGDSAGFRLDVKKGKLVVALSQGDSFLRQLPGGNIEVPFDIAMVADTKNGLRFEGGTGIKVNLPVSASLFGVFTVQFLELELKFQPTTTLDVVGGFSLKIGPFAASVDRVGARLMLGELANGVDSLADLVKFAPPKGLGLVLDAGAVKGGGYLFIDAEKGEYAGALELKFLNFSIKAIGLLSTKRPDGSEGWSLLLMVFGQFSIHIVFGIFWTGIGGMIGLHHRSDIDALTAGMKTGALDDILFPENPVADAPRIINRYRTLFPVQEGNFLVGPMLELSFSEPPIVYVRIGLILDIRNAIGGDGPMALSKVILIGQVLVQLPPKATGAPAILKLLIDIVGFYDADTEFLMIRARLRDSFVGIEHVIKLDLSGEFLLAIQFGAEPSFVLSAGGFHPKYQGLPARVPRDLDRLKVSFKIGPIKLSVEQYFAVTPNSVQAGQKASLVADFGVAGIEASLGWDALLYLSPRFYFEVDVEFKAKVKAFGETLMSVGVSATIEGPDQWHVHGKFSFSILWWDKSVSFDERWGEVEDAGTQTTSLGQALQTELSNPDNVTPEAPVGGSSPISLAPPGGTDKLAHPLGRLSIRQHVAPFDLQIDRLGTKMLTGGAQSVAVDKVKLNDAELDHFDSTTDSFARGQFTALSDDDKLTGKVFETFRCGVMVGAADFVTPDALNHDVTASFETIRLDPQPSGILTKWSRAVLPSFVISHESAIESSKLGAAARSDRALAQQRRVSTLSSASVSVNEPPLALVTPGTLAKAADLVGPATQSASLAAQAAFIGGQKLVEAFEVVG